VQNILFITDVCENLAETAMFHVKTKHEHYSGALREPTHLAVFTFRQKPLRAEFFFA
jgi:hypothetical protein